MSTPATAQEIRRHLLSMKQDATHNKHPVNQVLIDQATFGERLADQIAAGIGSWKFLIIQSIAVLSWVGLNIVGLVNHCSAGEHRPLKKDGLTHLIERLGKTAEIAKPVHPHVLRHTFATRAAARGVDPLMLADQFGSYDVNDGSPLYSAQRSAFC